MALANYVYSNWAILQIHRLWYLGLQLLNLWLQYLIKQVI